MSLTFDLFLPVSSKDLTKFSKIFGTFRNIFGRFSDFFAVFCDLPIFWKKVAHCLLLHFGVVLSLVFQVDLEHNLVFFGIKSSGMYLLSMSRTTLKGSRPAMSRKMFGIDCHRDWEYMNSSTLSYDWSTGRLRTCRRRFWYFRSIVQRV